MRKRIKISLIFVIVLIIGFLIPQNLTMPVEGASQSDYNSKSFWYYPWGKSGTHKGVDIFAKKGTAIKSSTRGFILYSGNISLGGKCVVILGPKWRLHYYAHLDELKATSLSYVNSEITIGTVGTSGNAVGKAPHLHYSIATILPYVWRIDTDKQGWKKMFYLNPIEYFQSGTL